MKVSVVALPTKVSVAEGKVKVTSEPGLAAASKSSFVSAPEPSKIRPVVEKAA